MAEDDRIGAAPVPMLGRWSVVGLVLNSVIGAGVFGLPSLVARSLGSAAPWAFLASFCVMCPIVAVFAWLSAGSGESGGQYVHVRNVLGGTSATVVGWFMLLVRLSSAAAVTNLFVVYLGEFFPSTSDGLPRALVLVAVVGSLGVANLRGIRNGVGVSNALTLVKLASLGAFVLLGLIFARDIAGSSRAEVLRPARWFEALLALTFAYGGFDNALIPAGETKNAQRSTPFALYVGMATVSVLYVLVHVVSMWLVPDLAHVERPLAAAARSFAGTWGSTAMALAALASAFGWLSAAFVAVPRLIAAMATGGALPRGLANEHARFHTPRAGTILWTVCLLVLAFGRGFIWNAQLSAGARLVTYFTAALVVLCERRRRRGVGIVLAACAALGFCAVLASQLEAVQFWILAFVCAAAASYSWLAAAIQAKPSGMVA